MPLTRSKPPAQSPVAIAIPPPAPVEAEFSGQRRLIRPSLAARPAAARQGSIYGHGSALTARGVAGSNGHEDSSHAEVFYFQKQIQAQTRIVVVLENGDQLEGVVEWYDRYAIKMRSIGHSTAQEANQTGGRTRVLVYKDCIRYIYKAGENAPQTMT